MMHNQKNIKLNSEMIALKCFPIFQPLWTDMIRGYWNFFHSKTWKAQSLQVFIFQYEKAHNECGDEYKLKTS